MESQLMKHGIVLLTALAFSCRAGHSLSRQDQEQESAPVVQNAEIDAIAATVTSGEIPTTNSAPQEEKNKPKETDPEEQEVAMEPVSIGGAFLTCSYPPNQMQGQTEYNMECAIAPLTDIKTPIVQASFVKLNGLNAATPLTVVTQNLLTLRWTIKEPASSVVTSNRVRVSLGLLGGTLATLTTTVTSPLALARSAAYWLGGEPNNYLETTGEDEDCMEFSNSANKKHHAEFTGLTTGVLGRMNDIQCSVSERFLCRNISGGTAAKWKVSTLSAPYNQFARACGTGYAFGFPLSEAEVKEVSALVDPDPELLNIWINMSDRIKEGEYVVPMR